MAHPVGPATKLQITYGRRRLGLCGWHPHTGAVSSPHRACCGLRRARRQCLVGIHRRHRTQPSPVAPVGSSAYGPCRQTDWYAGDRNRLQQSRKQPRAPQPTFFARHLGQRACCHAPRAQLPGLYHSRQTVGVRADLGGDHRWAGRSAIPNPMARDWANLQPVTPSVACDKDGRTKMSSAPDLRHKKGSIVNIRGADCYQQRSAECESMLARSLL